MNSLNPRSLVRVNPGLYTSVETASISLNTVILYYLDLVGTVLKLEDIRVFKILRVKYLRNK